MPSKDVHKNSRMALRSEAEPLSRIGSDINGSSKIYISTLRHWPSALGKISRLSTFVPG